MVALLSDRGQGAECTALCDLRPGGHTVCQALSGWVRVALRKGVVTVSHTMGLLRELGSLGSKSAGGRGRNFLEIKSPLNTGQPGHRQGAH